MNHIDFMEMKSTNCWRCLRLGSVQEAVWKELDSERAYRVSDSRTGNGKGPRSKVLGFCLGSRARARLGGGSKRLIFAPLAEREGPKRNCTLPDARFSPELVDHVLDNVAFTGSATGDTKDIGTCGSVFKRWLPSSRKHLFSHLAVSNSGSPTPQSFLDLADGSSEPILSLVRTIHLGLAVHDTPIADDHIWGLLMSPVLRLDELCIYSVPGFLPDPEKFKFLQWVHTGIPRMGSSLTRLRLILPTHFPLDVLADILSGLPCLTELKMRSKRRNHGYGVLAPFPPHSSGTSFFFEWLLSHANPPMLTSLTIDACAPNAEHEVAPLETYLCRFGARLRSLSLAYRLTEKVDGWDNFWNIEGTRAFHARTLPYTPRLVHHMLFAVAPETFPSTLTALSASRLASLNVGVYLRTVDMRDLAPPPDWAGLGRD
ncbi:hypothetical protein B0H16DRAFT_1454724 [Mycena metata]|uniref:Uncharacterized protein n=1 Tax=Mycena metata TaxID=1033252 RepID=A0AAD7JK02_9AGAR|nr:hypothetical protein B0H16DRAFT_1454724 [Mycena metata]